MFEIVFLGTSASAPSVQRGLSAQIVMYKDFRFLVDCGEGTQRQILRSGKGFRRLDKILLTHGHLDHVLGLGGLISTFARWEAMDQIEIWGGRSTLDRVHSLIFDVVLRGDRPPVKIDLIPIPSKGGIVMADEDFEVRAFPVQHRGPDCFGYAFEEKARRPFLNDLAEQLGVPRGPERRDLVRGIAVTLPGGGVVQPDQVLGEETPGVKLCITGDLGRTDTILEQVQGADALVCEATYMHHEAELAARFGHLTGRQAAELARDAGVGSLLLTHLSRRYRERDLLAEALETFPNSIVARDFDHFSVRRGQALERIESENPRHAGK